jgi:hypothetical protein
MRFDDSRNYELLPETLAGLHFVVVAMLMLVHAVPILQSCLRRPKFEPLGVRTK